ncbi:hypothetical protein KFK09_012751 [Dendrobium nobile]|uniref:Uncharacterized protein n=1 Tax=Dendrobium nobile TaxID=94219 RepID=A0A8T3BK51_DENNO|nr:hypothetical protein KFK09_012748 [Dendrobium nobile]KAI0512115.1 hypothetical protein KFK09_012751 [Dendrobium nobile]
MDQQEGWPLGLQPLSLRLGLIRNFDLFDSVSFSSANTGSSRSTSLTSSDFDSEERNVTLGSFVGIRGSILDLSRRPSRRSRRHESLTEKKQKNKPWFSLCTKPQLEFEKGDCSQSLGQFLEMERKACNLHESTRVHSGICHTNNSHGLPLIFQCIGKRVAR